MEFIYIEQNSLPNDLCDEIIDFFNKSPEYTTPGRTSSGVKLNIKKTTDLFIVKTRCPFEEKIDKILFDILYNNLQKMNYTIYEPKYNDINTGLEKSFDTGYQIQHYKKNEGYYIPHNDFGTTIRNNIFCHRIFTFIWYLNTVEEGGETEFLINGNPKIKPEKGKLVIFPSNITYPHQGRCPISSDKYIITGWIYSENNTENIELKKKSLNFPTRIKL